MPSGGHRQTTRRTNRRNPARIYTAAAFTAAALLILFNILTWKERLVPALFGTDSSLFAAEVGAPPSPLTISVAELPHARLLSNGDIVQPLAVRVVNPTRAPQPLPKVRATMLDADNDPVFSWTFGAKETSLPPGKSTIMETRAVNFPTEPRPVGLQLQFAPDARP